MRDDEIFLHQIVALESLEVDATLEANDPGIIERQFILEISEKTVIGLTAKDRTAVAIVFTTLNVLTKSAFDREHRGQSTRPEEIASAVLWLCSDPAAFMVGHAMVIDGGQTA